MKLFKKAKKGFTLVELVVVIAVIAILAAVSVGAYFGVTTSANNSQADQEAKALHTSIMLVTSNPKSGFTVNEETGDLVFGEQKDADDFKDAILDVTGIEYTIDDNGVDETYSAKTIVLNGQNGEYSVIYFTEKNIGRTLDLKTGTVSEYTRPAASN